MEAIIISTVLFTAALLALRGVFLWFWKVNEQLEKQDQIIHLLKNIVENTNHYTDDLHKTE